MKSRFKNGMCKGKKKQKQVAGVFLWIICSIVLALWKNGCYVSAQTQNIQTLLKLPWVPVPLTWILDEHVGLGKEPSQSHFLSASPHSFGLHTCIFSSLCAFMCSDSIHHDFFHFSCPISCASIASQIESLKPMTTKGCSPVQGWIPSRCYKPCRSQR